MGSFFPSRSIAHALSIAIFVVLGMTLGCGPEPSGSEALDTEEQALTPPFVTFDYSMPPMFGNDFDADGIIDLQPVSPSDPALSPVVGNPVRPTAWKVTLDACGSAAGGQYAWDVVLPTGVAHYDAGWSCRTTIQVPAQGSYSVTLTATYTNVQLPTGGVTTMTVNATRTITVKNYLVVSVGDSIASGEGTPDVPGVWVNDGWRAIARTPPRWSNQRCHRSANSGHARAALALEQADSHSSVTFISLACSGASILTGLLNPYFGQELPPSTGWRNLPKPLPPQIDEAARLTCPPASPTLGAPPCASIDALLVNAGANDVGFGDIVTKCATPFDSCHADLFFTFEVLARFAALPGIYDQLATRIKEKLNVKQVLVSEYHDPTHTDNGGYCSEMVLPGAVSDATITLPVVGAVDGHINGDEVVWAHRSVVLPLNRALIAASQKHGWKPVTGIAQEFRKHGYCANDRWIVRYDESKQRQFNIDGTMHPNVAGHQAMGRHIFAALEADRTFPRNRLAAVAQSTNDDLRLFARGPDDAIHMRFSSSPKWGAWSPLGGAMSSPPAAIEPAASQVMVLAVDKTGALQQNTYFYETGAFSGWQSYGKTVWDADAATERALSIVDTPAAARGPDGNVRLVAVGDDGRLWHMTIGPRTSPSSFSGFSTQWTATNSPPILGRPTIVAGGGNELDVAVRGADQALWHGFMNRGTWTWESLGGVILGNPKITSGAPGRLDIFAIGTDHALYHQWGWTGWWGGWESFGGYASSDPDVVVWGVDRDDMFVRSRTNAPEHKLYGGTWNALTAPVDLASAVHVVIDGEGVEDAFAELTDGSIGTWSLRNGTWSGMTKLSAVGARR